jgi:hypothetical protein
LELQCLQGRQSAQPSRCVNGVSFELGVGPLKKSG